MAKIARWIFAAGLLSIIASIGRADTLDDVRQRGVLRWGGDQEGGGPYIYPDPNDPTRVIGFEVELMDLVAGKLHLRSEFHQVEWENLPDQLRLGGIDVIVNGYELTEARRLQMLSTIPYYVYELQLLGRRNDASLAAWDDLTQERAKPKTIGVLGGSAADLYARALKGGTAVRRYTVPTLALGEVASGNLDATLQDLPIAIFYRNRYPELRFVGDPVGKGFYVMYLQREAEGLRGALDRVLLELIHEGKLQSLYERYGLWNKAQEQLGTPGLGMTEPDPTMSSTEQSGWSAVTLHLPILLEAAWVTVWLTFLAMPLAIGLGLLVALGRLYAVWPVRWLLGCYVEVLRGTPLYMQLFTIYFVLPRLFGFTLDARLAAIMGLAINYSAYESEIYRAGLLAIPHGQMEAALSLGMSRYVALRRVVVPQAVRIVIPAVTNDFVALFKDTSLCSVITVVELSKQYSILVGSTNAYFELMLLTSLLYLGMSFPLTLLARTLERRRNT